LLSLMSISISIIYEHNRVKYELGSNPSKQIKLK